VRIKQEQKRRIIGGRSAEKVQDKNSIPQNRKAEEKIMRISPNP